MNEYIIYDYLGCFYIMDLEVSKPLEVWDSDH